MSSPHHSNPERTTGKILFSYMTLLSLIALACVSVMTVAGLGSKLYHGQIKPIGLMSLTGIVVKASHHTSPIVVPERTPAEQAPAEQTPVKQSIQTQPVVTPAIAQIDEQVVEQPQTLAAPQPRLLNAVVNNTPRNTVTFNDRPLRKVKTIRMLVTAYSPDARSCGKWADGRTASGYSVWTNGMKLVAADTKILPFGSIITVPGYHDGKPVPVLDRGGKIKGMRLDVLYPTHEIALQWGKHYLDVDVWEYAD
ncbi:MAG: hypothetical protein GC164_07785 [Phycisphaera sp.]|nr:hypothetical protein [Phycisphaera sp.]